MNVPSAGFYLDNQKNKNRKKRLLWQIWAATACRLLLNTARRFAYPFAPALSRGLQVSLVDVTSLIAINQFTGLFGLLGGPLSDRWGYRRMVLAGMTCMAVGMLLVAVLPGYATVLIALLCAGLGKSIYDPAIQAYAGQQVPFAQRGRMIGILEVSWAGSALLGIPLIGLLIQHQGWSSPFWLLGISGLAGISLLAWLIPKPQAAAGTQGRPANLRIAWGRLFKQREAAGLLGFGFWVSFGNDQLFVVYGAWMEQAFQTPIAMLGLGTAILGVAELCGEGLTAWIGDRMGLKRAIIVGSILCTAGYLLMPFTGSSLWLAWGGLFFIFLNFEFSMVSCISLSTEAIPDLRATMMAGFYAAAGIGRVAGAFLGGLIWLHGGIDWIGACSAMANIAALLCLLWGLKGFKSLASTH
jgi:predicted MFS family arabinose efflux permease